MATMSGSAPNENTRAHALRIAAAPVTWNNNDLENWRPLIPFPEILDRIASAGYTATEFDDSFGEDPGIILAEAKACNLVYCGSYQWLDLNTTDDVIEGSPALRSKLDLLQAIDCRNLIIADSLRPHRIEIAGAVPNDGSESLDRSGFQRIAANAGRVADLAARHGIHVHYHNHVGTYVETPDEVAALLAELDTSAIGMCFDTGHYAFAGGDARSFVADNPDVIGYIHLKDVDASVMAEAHAHHWSFLDALRHYVFTDLGTGVAQTDEIVDILQRRPARPWIVIEQDTCSDDATITAAKNLQTVQRVHSTGPH